MVRTETTNREKVMNRLRVYIAAGWFNPTAADSLSQLETLLEELDFNVASPRKIFVCPPTASEDVQQNTFDGNLREIENSDFILSNSTGGFDTGTVWESGYAYANNVPIVYFCQGLKGNFNLMLSRSGVKVCTSYEQLREYLTRVQSEGKVITEMYKGVIE